MPVLACSQWTIIKKRKESNNINIFSSAKKKTRKYYSAIQSPDKVLQRYTKPPQDIVVYLKSPRRRREKIVCTTFLQSHVAKNPGS